MENDNLTCLKIVIIKYVKNSNPVLFTLKYAIILFKYSTYLLLIK